MAIRSFAVGARRGLVAASADALPNIVAIAGPNGSGKSALLEQIWQLRGNFLEAGTEALYVGPNRAWRAGALSDLAARSFTQDYEAILKSENIPGFQYLAPGGHNFLSGLSRFGSNADDAQALVKTSIVRISNRADNFVMEQFRRQGGQIAPGSVPDLLSPLGELIETLLPHLRFAAIDSTNPNDIRVTFGSKDPERAGTFDIDDLSSGEKAAIALFLPFIERRVREIVEGAPGHVPGGLVPLTLLLDEPEIHLHPLLQLNVLEYMRRLARDGEAQFIFTTHSPSMLDALEPNELYLLSPASIAPENQISRLSFTAEKLEVARSLTGSTHLLTRGKPIVFVEGEPNNGPVASDQRLLKLLAPSTEHWAIIPSHGRSQVTRAVTDMQSANLSLPGLPVFGLVDGDQSDSTGNDHVIVWPVAMVENLLLDAEAISQVLEPYGTHAQSEQSVSESLDTIGRSMREVEIRLRVQAEIPTRTIRPSGAGPSEIIDAARTDFGQFEQALLQMNLSSITKKASDEVDGILQNGSYLERFRGKPILREFYRRHRISETGLGWNAFVTELARKAAGGDRTRALTGPALLKVELYFPAEVVTELEATERSEVTEDLLRRSRAARSDWEHGVPTASGRESLRQDLVNFARASRAAGKNTAEQLLHHAVAIGTSS